MCCKKFLFPIDRSNAHTDFVPYIKIFNYYTHFEKFVSTYNYSIMNIYKYTYVNTYPHSEEIFCYLGAKDNFSTEFIFFLLAVRQDVKRYILYRFMKVTRLAFKSSVMLSG